MSKEIKNFKQFVNEDADVNQFVGDNDLTKPTDNSGNVIEVGDRIRMTETMDDPQPIEAGDEGEVVKIDDADQIHMKWDSGRTLALIPSVDSFEKIDN